MSENITCPHCHYSFDISDAGYGEILNQVRTKEFNKQVDEKITAYKKNEKLNIDKLKLELTNKNKEDLTGKNKEIDKLHFDIEKLKLTHQASVKDAISKVEKEKDKVKMELSEEKHYRKLSDSLLEKNYTQQIQQQKENYQIQLKDRDDTIERLKDFKTRLSTKMIGESLEVHCETEFNKLRATAFPHAYFEKDNDARTGSKGDFIFKDYDEDGEEIVSIMFEMKNEADGTATKKKNTDFLKELNKDREEKGCEYAVLVSLLEPDSEYYNTGIVDMLHYYPKMYVVRPQFFIPIITLIRNGALTSLKYKKEVQLMAQRHIDVTHFEEKLQSFKEDFYGNYERASRYFARAIDDIDKTIKQLTKIKDTLMGTDRNLRIANDKAQDMSIRKLTYKNPTMRKKFSDLKGD